MLLQEIATVKVAPQNLIVQTLSPQKRAKLRREAIKEYVRRQPYGQRIKTREFAEVGSFKRDSAAFVFVEKMVRKGEIIKHEISQRRFFYTVPGPLTVKAIDKTPAVVEAIANHKQEEAATDIPPLSQLENLAMRYRWYKPEGSVRDFVNYVKSQQEYLERITNMAGTKSGGLAAAATNRAKYGADFYAKIGAMGGKVGRTGGFGQGEDGRRRASIYGRIGGVKSKRKART